MMMRSTTSKFDLNFVREIKALYEQKYVHQEPYSQYAKPNCSIFRLSVLVNLDNGITLQPWESLDDYCLKVNLSKLPPAELKLPSFYLGVRVYYGVVKEIKG